MKARVVFAALVFSCSALAETDFFGIPITPAPATPRPAKGKPGAGKPGAGDAAEGSEAGAPPELAGLKQHFQQELATAIKPSRDRYVTGLQSLMRSLIQKNDLEGAVAVQGELAIMTGTAAADASEASTTTEKDFKPPPELVTLQQRYERDLEAWSKPARDHYATALQGLLRATLQKGDLPGANVIQDEMATARAPILSEREAMRKALLDWKWSWTGAAMETDVFMTFLDDGTVSHRGMRGTWKIVGAHDVKLMENGGRTFVLHFNDGLDSYKSMVGPELHGHRSK